MSTLRFKHWTNPSRALSVLVVFIYAACSSAPSAQAQSLDNDQGAIELSSPGDTGPAHVDESAPIRESAPPGGSGGGSGDQPHVGRKAAEKYMTQHPGHVGHDEPAPRERERRTDAHYLAMHVGLFASDTAYRWGSRDPQSDVGRWNLGITYRVGEWVNSMDVAMRVELSNYQLDDGTATKLSFVPLITFPDASSHFPLYFGVGAGLGIFLNQIDNKSPLALDYQVLAGARFFDVFKDTGFFIEAGIKNHVFLTSSGQYNGTFAAVGVVFLF